jgi:hypothetical protein
MKHHLKKSKLTSILNKLKEVDELEEAPEKEAKATPAPAPKVPKSTVSREGKSTMDRLNEMLGGEQNYVPEEDDAVVDSPPLIEQGSNRKTNKRKEGKEVVGNGKKLTKMSPKKDPEEEGGFERDTRSSSQSPKHKNRKALERAKKGLLNAMQGEEEGEDSEREEEGDGGIGRKGGVRGGNPTLPMSTLLDQQMLSILKNMPKDRRDLEKELSSYVGKLKYLAIRKAEKLLTQGSNTLSPSELVKLTQSLTDMQLTMRWTKKLEKAILENPSKLNRPGQGNGWSLLSQLQKLSVSTKNESKRDGRTSGVQKSYEVLDLPGEEEGSKHAV